jgi:hypothetical protein
MAPAKITTHGGVEMSLDEYTEAIVDRAARAAVDRHIETCPIMQEHHAMHADIYGLPGLKEEGQSPGLMGDVADLKRSRNLARIGLRCIWGILISSPVIAWLLGLFGLVGQQANHAK